VLGACTVGAPPGFSNGERWTFPLVDPLEGGVLVTPVTIHGQGPYLFVIDPDANVSAVDAQVVAAAGLRTGPGPRRLDEAGTEQDRVYAEVLEMKIGNLSIDRRPAMVVPVGLYDTGGRHVSGVLGHDVIAGSLVFGFDRDQGLVMLTTAKAFHPPDRGVEIVAQAVASRTASPEVQPVPRRLASATVNGTPYLLHLDLGAKASQLRDSHWGNARLSPIPARLTLVDEAGTTRAVTQAGTAKTVVLGGATREGTLFIPYEDQRWETEGVDGTLGLDFFSPFSVSVSWERGVYYLTARADAAATSTARLARWGSALPSCPHPGCVTTDVVAGAADDPSGVTGVTVTVTRDAEAAGHALQVVLAATPVAGKPAPGWIVANLSPDADKLSHPFGSTYAGVTFQVLDASPFPRACPDKASGCLGPFGSPDGDGADGAAAAPSPPPVPPTVTPDKLHRLTGEATVAPGDAARQAIAAAGGAPPAVAIVKICVTGDGKIESARLIKTSKVAAYDEQLIEAIKGTWTFEPVVIDGKATAVCSPVVFKAP
jgi:hypothetical protein